MQLKDLLSHPQDLDAPLRLTAQRKINGYRQQYADNQNIYFLPAILTTSTRMHGKLLRLLFLQATALDIEVYPQRRCFCRHESDSALQALVECHALETERVVR